LGLGVLEVGRLRFVEAAAAVTLHGGSVSRNSTPSQTPVGRTDGIDPRLVGTGGRRHDGVVDELIVRVASRRRSQLHTTRAHTPHNLQSMNKITRSSAITTLYRAAHMSIEILSTAAQLYEKSHCNKVTQ